MKRVLITGAGGFTGRYLAPKLAGAGYAVHGTQYAADEPPVEGVSDLHVVDLTDAQSVMRIVADVKPTNVVHLAGISFVGHCDVDEIYRANIVGTRNLFDALARNTTLPRSIVLASSANVYGNSRSAMLDESVPVSPVNDYGVTKAAAELVAGMYKNRLPIIVVRPFNYTGVGQSDQFIVPKIISHVRSGASEIELGNLSVERDFSDVRVVVEAYARLLESKAAVGETFNVCTGRTTSVRELIDLIAEISGHELKVRTNSEFVRADEVTTLCGSPKKLEAVIGALPIPPLEETLEWMLKS